ncbi:MAG: penicillin-binding protein activator [Alphaproteobacteria bacterium]
MTSFPVRRLFAATLIIVLTAFGAGCAHRVPERPAPPQAAQPPLLPPAAEAKKEAERLPESIIKPLPPTPRRPAPPTPKVSPGERPAVEVIPPEVALAPLPAQPVPPLLPGEPAKVAVGLLVPLSGPQSEVGAALLDAAQMALFDMGDTSLTLLPRDTGGTPEGAARAAREVLDEGARLILGPLLASEVQAVAPEARAAGVNVVAFSTDRTVAAPGVFVMGVLPRDQVFRVVAYAVSQGRTRFAALSPDTAYGSTVVDALKIATVQNNAVVTQVETYSPGANMPAVVKRFANYESRRAALDAQIGELEAKGDEVSRQAAARLKAMGAAGDVGFDAVMIPEGGERLREIAPLLPYYDIDTNKVRLLGTNLWNDVSLGTEPALQGGWFAAPDPGPRAEFMTRFASVYGHRPHGLASLGYDGAALAAVLARESAGPDFSAAALTAAHGFAGVDGIFRFHPDGLSERGLAVLEIRRDAFKVMSPAPEAFTTLAY